MNIFKKIAVAGLALGLLAGCGSTMQGVATAPSPKATATHTKAVKKPVVSKEQVKKAKADSQAEDNDPAMVVDSVNLDVHKERVVAINDSLKAEFLGWTVEKHEYIDPMLRFDIKWTNTGTKKLNVCLDQQFKGVPQINPTIVSGIQGEQGLPLQQTWFGPSMEHPCFLLPGKSMVLPSLFVVKDKLRGPFTVTINPILATVGKRVTFTNIHGSEDPAIAAKLK